MSLRHHAAIFTAIAVTAALAPAYSVHAKTDAPDQPVSPNELIQSVDNFRLMDHNGGSHELARYADAKAIVIYATTAACPEAAADLPALAALQKEFEAKGIMFFGIDGDLGVDREKLAEEADAIGHDIPILIDDSTVITQDLGMSHTGEAVLIDTATWAMAYRGNIDGLGPALTAFINDDSIEQAVTTPTGIAYTRAPQQQDITYIDHAAPILANNCVECHSPGNIGPFSLSSYRKVRGWAPMMKEVILTKRMPPWHADPHYKTYANDKSLTPEETRTLVSWIDAGAPRGDGEDPLPIAVRENAARSDWHFGTPDLVVEMSREESLPAQGVFDYRYQRVQLDMDEDKWVRSIEMLPGNREVLHHALIFVEYPERLSHLQPEYHGGAGGYFAGYVPGKLPIPFPEGTGKFLPKDATIVFQLHYTATGKPETDKSAIGLYFHDEQPEMALKTRSATDRNLRIPPHERDVSAKAMYRITEDSLVWSLNPHMHLRGQKVKYTAQLPDGSEQVLLNVPFYDFNWQTEYRFDEPIKLPAGSRVVCEGAHDNSATNPHNPDPEEYVYWGSQSWEEMFIGFLTYSPLPEDQQSAASRKAATFEGPLTPETIVGTEWQFMRFNLFFDKDGVLIVDNSINGTWEWNNDEILINVAGRSIVINVEDDALSVRGNKLKPAA